MRHYCLQRLLETVPLLTLLSFLVFALFKLIPGDYLTEMEMDPTVSRQRVEQLRQEFGLEQPLLKQYVLWVGRVLQGNLGYSFAQRRAAIDLIAERVVGTLILTAGALGLTVLLALPLGAVSALHLGDWRDRLILFASFAALSLPTVLCALLLLYFAYLTGWFPVGGADSLYHAILPALTLAFPMLALFLRTFRLELADVLAQPYILAAAAKGLPKRRILWHAFRNALNPIISLTGITIGGLLSGAVIVEKVFGWPGLGSLIVDSILSRDLFVALDCVLVSAAMVVAANLVADLFLAWNDPQIRCR